MGVRTRLRTAAAGGAALAAMVSSLAQEPKIHMGITAPELAHLLARDGWTGDRPAALERHSLMLRHQNGGRWIFILLHDCDAGHRCRTGHIRATTYFTVSPQFAWTWNEANKGAVAYGTSYLSLMRPLHFRGVTDLYLREVILEEWPRADAKLWTDAYEHYEERERAPDRKP